MNLTLNVSTSSSSVNHPVASKSQGILKASAWKLDARERRNSKPDAALSSQGRLKDAYFGGLMVEVAVKPAATDESQESWEFSESESWSNHEEKVTSKPVASRNSGNSGNSEAGSRKWPHNFHMSPAAVPRMEKVYSVVRQVYGRSPTNDLGDLDVNNAVWVYSLQAAVHLRSTQNQLLKSFSQLFQVTEKLIKDQTEIGGLTTIDYKELTWISTTYYVTKHLRSRMPKPMSSPTRCHVWEVWVTNQLKLGQTILNGICQIFESNRWRADWVRVKNIPRIHNIGNSRRDAEHDDWITVWTWAVQRKDHPHVNAQPTLYGENEETLKNVRWILLQLRIMPADSCSDVGHFWVQDQRRNGTELTLINQTEIGTRLLKEWCSTLPKAVIQYFVPPALWKEKN